MAKEGNRRTIKVDSGGGVATATRVTARSSAKSTGNSATLPAALTEQMIRERAYQIYLRRNGAPGDPAADWAQAERELRTELKR